MSENTWNKSLIYNILFGFMAIFKPIVSSSFRMRFKEKQTIYVPKSRRLSLIPNSTDPLEQRILRRSLSSDEYKDRLHCIIYVSSLLMMIIILVVGYVLYIVLSK